MDYSILTNPLDHPAALYDNFTAVTTTTTATILNTSRKRNRSDSFNQNDLVQKTIRLMSPPRPRATNSSSNYNNSINSDFNPEAVRQTSNNEKNSGSKTFSFQMLDFRESEPMECDNDLQFSAGSNNFGLGDGEMGSSSASASTSNPSLVRRERGERQTHLPYTMGYRADCEKCRLKVPGHYAHVFGK
ncbi:hypothetical protein G9A89_023501 [Geosiphon pyriformis]|nr:hypothetical protein G9A89_023501 [Geosiphon pyriformis]